MRSAAVAAAGSRARVAWLPRRLVDANGQRCGLAIDLYDAGLDELHGFSVPRTRNSARRRGEASSAVSQSSKARAEGHSFKQGISEAPRAYAVTITHCSPSARSKPCTRAFHIYKRCPRRKQPPARLRRVHRHQNRRARRCGNCAASSRTCCQASKPTTRRRRPWRSGV